MESKTESGQVLLEFVLMVPLLALAVAGTFALLRATAVRTECSRVVFETVRSALNDPPNQSRFFARGSVIPHGNGVLLREAVDGEGIEGWKKCGARVEHLFLPYLGKRKPGP